MISKASIAFAKLYLTEKDSHSNDSATSKKEFASPLAQYAFDFGENVAAFNKGMMSQMQENPTDTDNECYKRTAATNAEILILSDFSEWLLGGFDQVTYLDQVKIMNFQFTSEMEACRYNEFLISLDGMLTSISRATAAGVNLTTQLMTGYTNQDTSIYLAVSKISDGWQDDRNWETLG